jgi:hypothetical protein
VVTESGHACGKTDPTMTTNILERFLISIVCIAFGVVLIRNRANAPQRWEAAGRMFPKHWRRPTPSFATWNQAASGVPILGVGVASLVFAFVSLFQG